VLEAADFGRMCEEGRFARVASTHVSTEEHRMHGAGFTVRAVPGDPELGYAIGEDRSLGARLVSAKDRVAWRLDIDALRASMAADLGATPADVPIVLDGVLDLGVVPLASGRLRFVYAMAEPPAGWLDAVRRASPLGVTPVALVPRGHAPEATGIVAVELDLREQLGAKRITRALGRAAESLGVADEVEVWRRWDEELLVERKATVIWAHGVRVLLSERPHRLLVLLAESAGQVLATRDLGLRLSTGGAPDVTARKAKAEAERQMRGAFEEAGADARIVEGIIVADGRKGYRLGVSARVI
jgi:hypothetical protein